MSVDIPRPDTVGGQWKLKGKGIGMKRMIMKALLWVALAACLGGTAAQAAVELNMYYPVAVGGPITKVIDDMIAEFEKSNPDIKVKAVYAGNYDDTRVKALAALKANHS